MKAAPLIAFMLFSVACTSTTPVAVRSGDVCFHCRRTITEPKVATEMFDTTNHVYKFASGSMGSLRRGLSTTAGLWWSATQLADVLVMGNGIDANYKYDGTRLLPLGAKYIPDMESAEGVWVGGTANTEAPISSRASSLVGSR